MNAKKIGRRQVAQGDAALDRCNLLQPLDVLDGNRKDTDDAHRTRDADAVSATQN